MAKASCLLPVWCAASLTQTPWFGVSRCGWQCTIANQTLSSAVEAYGIPERSLKRRFKIATGTTLIGRVQNLRIEEAKRLLETESVSADEISAIVGYDNPAFFRRLFKRCTGLTPGAYRRMFRPMAASTGPSNLAPPYRGRR